MDLEHCIPKELNGLTALYFEQNEVYVLTLMDLQQCIYITKWTYRHGLTSFYL